MFTGPNVDSVSPKEVHPRSSQIALPALPHDGVGVHDLLRESRRSQTRPVDPLGLDETPQEAIAFRSGASNEAVSAPALRLRSESRPWVSLGFDPPKSPLVLG